MVVVVVIIPLSKTKKMYMYVYVIKALIVDQKGNKTGKLAPASPVQILQQL